MIDSPSTRSGHTTAPAGGSNSSFRISTSLLLFTIVVAVIFVIQTTTYVDGFIKFGYILNTTACDTCDELRTYSGRNVFCCLAQSKCCGPNSLDELDALTTTVPAP